ncbi:Hsp70 family protein [Nisaea sp.]|uniref:Hsp70 family protein n=1 Tax=Nisaea sp. TaxID=2024842 RepID=UPI00326720EF
MKPIVAGLDFGTSNSAIGYASGNALDLHRFEHGGQSVPTALFYDEEEGVLVSGHDAETRFLQGHEGRYLRALKSILGTSLADDVTRMGARSWPFRSLLTSFLIAVKKSVETASGGEIAGLVAGRPVRFVDEDETRDKRAETLLREVLEEAGFGPVHFVFEPVAALIDAEAAMQDPVYVLVADIGGGTSDFTLARRSADGGSKEVAGFEILANHGVHIGGTDLDKRLSLKAVMPAFGYGTEMKALTSDVMLPVPASYYSDLATWQKIHFCYTYAMKQDVREVMRQAVDPEKIELLLELLERQLGHRLVNAVEGVKIALSDKDAAVLDFPYIDDLPAIEVDRVALAQHFAPLEQQVAKAAEETLAMAGVRPEDVGHIVLTGGSTLLPDMRRVITGCVPAAQIVPSDPFTAVAKGLTKAAHRVFPTA